MVSEQDAAPSPSQGWELHPARPPSFVLGPALPTAISKHKEDSNLTPENRIDPKLSSQSKLEMREEFPHPLPAAPALLHGGDNCCSHQQGWQGCNGTRCSRDLLLPWGWQCWHSPPCLLPAVPWHPPWEQGWDGTSWGWRVCKKQQVLLRDPDIL